ncbi:MAG: hypothetical protein IKU80_03000, partial [Firmicutes bacterium]|nr:hypothetical protein [Bacillota bacterium]
EFVYSGEYPYWQLAPNPFYTFFLEREKANIKIKLKIDDRLDDYISVEQIMSITEFEKITSEFSEAAKKFSVR